MAEWLVYHNGELVPDAEGPADGDLEDAFVSSHGIKLMLYLPSRSPQRDQEAMEKLGDVHQRKPAPQGKIPAGLSASISSTKSSWYGLRYLKRRSTNSKS